MKENEILHQHDILLGYDATICNGNSLLNNDLEPSKNMNKVNSPLIYNSDSHLLTVAPTGSGKGVSAIIPNLLRFDGPVVVMDPKGENYNVTSEARRRMGHKVYKLDPFGVIDDKSDSLDPFDVFTLNNADRDTDAQFLADLMATENGSLKEPFWDLNAKGIIGAYLSYAQAIPELRTFGKIMNNFFSDDFPYTTAIILDTLKDKISSYAFKEMASFLQFPDKQTRPSVMGTAHSYLNIFLPERIQMSLNKSNININDIVSGGPISIYLIIPPDKLKSHKALLKIWIGVLFKAITSRKVIPQRRTLFILDEVAQLGHFPLLESIITLCRGYGVQTWTFWQDLSQLKTYYKDSWQTIINNSSVLQLFGAKNHFVRKEFAELSGVHMDNIKSILLNEQLVVINGEPFKSHRTNYLKDELFDGMFAKNPFYQNTTIIK